jgi:SM-20-related protein
MSDVRVKLLLQGGHRWEFYCDQDDPIIFGLLSALPGTGLNANLPPDGLVQIETRAGERLFLTRSSLVSLEIGHPTDPSKVDPEKHLTAFKSGIPEGMSGPSPFVLVPEALPNHIHRALIEHALARGNEASQSDPMRKEVRELGLGSLTQQVAMALRWNAEKSRAAFGIPDTLETHAQFRMFAIGNAQEVPLNAESNDALRLVYHFYKTPRMFTGGGVRLFDMQTSNAQRRLAFRDLEIEDNSLLVLPAHSVGAGLPVRCDNGEITDGLFVVYGALRRTGA